MAMSSQVAVAAMLHIERFHFPRSWETSAASGEANRVRVPSFLLK